MAGAMREYTEDVLALAGLALLGWGGWQISPAVGAMTLGGVLVCLVTCAAILRAIRNDS